MSTKVFLADDRQLLMIGLRGHLEAANIEVVGTTGNISGLAEKFIGSGADVLITDLRFQDEAITGLDVAAKLLQDNPATKIVLLSQFEDVYIIEKAYKLGILAFVGKNETEILVDAIQSVASGQKYLSPQVAQKIAMESIKTNDPRKLLIAQELKIFTLIADGKTPHEIAAQLDITYRTVNNAVGHIRKKLEIETYSEFTKLAIKYGLVTLS